MAFLSISKTITFQAANPNAPAIAIVQIIITLS